MTTLPFPASLHHSPIVRYFTYLEAGVLYGTAQYLEAREKGLLVEAAAKRAEVLAFVDARAKFTENFADAISADRDRIRHSTSHDSEQA